jgi:hypothetical protein
MEEELNLPNLEEILKDEKYNPRAMLEYMCLHRYPVIQITDEPIYFGEQETNYPGEFIEKYKTKSGLTVYIYEHAIVIGVADMAFAEYSNYSRMITALYEVYQRTIPEIMKKRDWVHLAFIGTHAQLEDVAWAVAKSLNLPVSELIDTPHAREIYLRITERRPGHNWLKPTLT